MRNVLVLLFLLLSLGAAQAQRALIGGKVMDSASNDPIIGANVYLQGTAFGTVTDLEGRYEISVAPGSYTIRMWGTPVFPLQ